MKRCLLIYVCLLFSVMGYAQTCTLNVSISASDTSICSGYSVVLTASTSSGTAPYSYIWSTGETTPSITINKGGTYMVTVGDNTPGCQPVVKSITISSLITPSAPTSSNAIVCYNNPATLTATAPGGTYQWYDAPTGGNFLASGATFTTPPVTATTAYYVQTTVSGCTSPRTTVYVSVSGNPGVNNIGICSGNTGTLTATGGTSYTWYDAPNGNQLATGATFTTPILTTTTTYYVVGIVNGCTSAYTPATVYVTAAPPAPTASGATVCTGSEVTLQATATTGVISWYSVPTGGTALISSPDFTTPPLNATTTYYVQTSNGCQSARTPVTVTVNPIPAAPGGQTDTACYNTSVTLTAAANPVGTYQWYDASGNFLFTGNTYTTPVLTSNTIYYVQVVNGGCASSQSAVTVIVKSPPAAPTAAGEVICSGTQALLTAIFPGGTYQWYDAATGGNLLATGATFTTPTLTATTTYYVQTTLNGCISSRSAITATVLAPTPQPTAAGASVCAGNAATLTGAGGTTYSWYDSSTGGNLLSVGQTYITPVLTSTTTYYLQNTSSNGCASVRTPVTVTVNPIPSAPTVSGTTICPGYTASLTANAAGGTAQWYDAATNGNLLFTGATYTTPALSATTTYYVQTVSASSCVSSSRAAVTVTVTSVASPQFQYLSGTICTSGANPTPVINNPAGGTFSASPAGLVFISTTTGQVNAALSLPGKYTISFAYNGPCPGTYTSALTVVLTPNAQFSYSGPFCQSGANPSPVFPAGASAGVFTASPAGLVFTGATTGMINLASSTPGTYTVTNTIAASGGCAASATSTSVTINQQPTISAGANQSVAQGSTVQLTGSVSGASGVKWSGGLGTFSNTTATNPVYTPGAGETSATLTITSTGAASPCGNVSSNVTITFYALPASPTAAGVTICSGSVATLSATNPGGTYQWYDAATGGNLLATGPSFTTPVLTANTTYYVQTTVNGATSNRTAVLVTVTTTAAPVAAGATVCYGTSATLTASGSTGTYSWYDAATGGNLLSLSNSYTPSALTTATSFYVQASNGGCVSSRTQVTVKVTPLPTVTSANTGAVCSGNPLNYTITANIAAATFSWSRAAVTGISNPAATNQTSSTITETLINPSSTAVTVTYVITPINNGCNGQAFNYAVTVFPAPTVTSAPAMNVCYGNQTNYSVTFNTTNTAFNWSRAAVTGISNAAISGQASATILETLYNTTNLPVTVNYVYNYNTSTCLGTPFNLAVTVNPNVGITSASSGSSCSGFPQAYIITSNVAAATFSWGRAAVGGISNTAVSNQTADTISETLVNTSSNPITVTYLITPTAYGCQGATFAYYVTVYPIPATPVANANSPVCMGSEIQLRTNTVNGASYLWTGPNGYSSTSQNPNITNVTMANTGNYSLAVIVNGCSSPVVTVPVKVNQPPIAVAGPDQTVCATATAINLSGSIGGGALSGIWTTSGTGVFLPASNTLNAQYIPTAADVAAGSVLLTLTSTSIDNCTPATASTKITFGQVPAVSAGTNQNACSQTTGVALTGTQYTTGTVSWSTSGTGTFSPSNTQLSPVYVPSAADITTGSVKLTLTDNGASNCFIDTASMTVRFLPPPTVNAGGTRYVLKGNTITLYPTVSETNVTYLWTPNVDINDNTVKNPVITGDVNITYTLTVTDTLGCTSSSVTNIIVSPQLNIPNTFTPNSDGINDYWDIKGLIAYTDAVVDIYNRYGTQLFHSIGYGTPWDGNYNGQKVPDGTYYYVINTHVNGQVLSGWVAVIR